MQQEQHLHFGDARIYYQVRGHGQPLVLVHGLSGSGRWWARNVRFLEEHFQLYLIDLIGFGHSRGSFILDEAAQLLVDWMDTLRISSANLVGHSMGGFIAADLAANHPDRIEKLVLVDAAAVPIRRTYLQTFLGLLLAFQYMPLGFLPVLVGDAWRAGGLTIWQATREIFRADIRVNLSKISAPTLILWGENDTVLPLEVGSRLWKHIPAAQFSIIHRAGHNPMWDRPRHFNQTVKDFLK